MTKIDKRLCKDIKNIFANGFTDKNPRPKYADGQPAHTISVNHVMRKYDLSNGEFPICSLRKIAWKSAIKEIMWIYQDKSNSLDLLKDKYGITWWDEWESNDIPGTIGIRYGGTVKKYNLIDNLIKDIKKDPYGRRHIMSLWQENDFKESDGLMPCAFLTIWNVRGEYIDMVLVQRSGDMLTASGAGGVNEVQYAALQLMVAKATGYEPGIFTHFVANEQIYDRHIEAGTELLKRYDLKNNIHKNSPMMIFKPSTTDFYDFSISDFELKDYYPIEPQIKLELGI